MRSPRLRVLLICLVAIALVAVGGLWVVADRAGQPGSDGTNARDAAATTSTAVAPTTTEAGKNLGAIDPVPAPTVPRVDPEVAAAVAATGSAEVRVVFDATITGTDEEKRTQVRSGIDAITASLPAGSWSIAGETPTIPVASLVVDAAALAALGQRSDVRNVNWASHEFSPAVASGGVDGSGDLATSATTSTMGAPAAWAAGFKGAGTTIAVVDTGVQTDHPYLMNGTVQKTVGEACFASATGYTSPCPGGVSMGINDPSKVGAGAPCPVDIVTNGMKECVHGTHVAGIAAGGSGSGTSGIAPAATLISVQVFSYKFSTNRITSTTGDLDDALQWLYNRRADFPGLGVVNLSLGDDTKYTGFCDTGQNASTKLAVQQLLNVGIVTVVAAGNDGWTDGVNAPACLSNVVAVSALGGGASDARADYSNVGPQVNVFAPGTLASSVPCDGTSVMRGTSMATPAVSGAIAILRQSTVAATVDLLESTGSTVPGFTQPSVKLNNAIVGLPGPPGAVTGVASGAQVTVSWSASSPGSGSITGYAVMARPGGQTCTTAGLSCVVTGLDPTKSYVFTVVPTGTSGRGPGASSAVIVMPNVPAAPNDYVALVPARLMDTRSVSAGASTIDGNDLGCGVIAQGLGGVRTLDVEGRAGVPTAGVDAVAINVTVVNPNAATYLTVYPSGTNPPNASNINFVPGQIIPNMAIVKVGTDGRIAIFNGLGATDLVIDIVGWFPDGADYTGVQPQRMLDTRDPGPPFYGGPTIDGAYSNTGPLQAQQTFVLPIAGRGTIPATGVGAVALNVTVVGPTVGNFVSVFPGDSTFGGTSNINFSAGQTIANMVITEVSPDGEIAIYNNAGATHIAVDVVGWFPTVSQFQSFPPQRFVDTRASGPPAYGGPTIDGQYRGIGPIAPGGRLEVQMTGRGVVPSTGVGAVALNVTVAGSTGSNFLTVYPSGGTMPTVSNLNFVAGDIIANMVIVKVGAGGRVTFYNNAGSTPLVVDVVGWFPG